MTLRYGHSLSLLAALLLLAVVSPAVAQSIDYDDNDNGLIDITTPAQLDAIRHDPNGNGDATHADYVAAFTDRDTAAATRMGCPSGTCTGYELRADINLSDYTNWVPIPTYTATFQGNGHTISNLTITSNTSDDAGLFGLLSSTGSILRVGVTDASVTGSRGSSQELGILAGESHGVIRSSYTTGTVTQSIGGNYHRTGGLVGHQNNGGSIIASYSTATVTGSPSGNSIFLYTGGLVGMNGEAGNTATGTIRSSYASGAVSAAGGGRIGGLVGFHFRGSISSSYAYGSVSTTGSSTSLGGLIGGNTPAASDTASYYDSDTSGRNDTGKGVPKTTAQLQEPTGYTGIYANWNIDLDGVTGTDDPWDFGAANQYPVLKFGRDAAAIAAQFAGQPGVPQGVTVTASAEDSLVVRWNAVSNATGYKVQWKSGNQNYPSSDQTSSTHGQDTISSRTDTTYAIAMLTMGTTYTVRVIAIRTGGDSGPSAEVMGVPLTRYDGDGNGLIEIRTLAQLNAIRWDLNGDGVVDTSASTTDSTAYVTAFPSAIAGHGCPATGCIGYELMVDLDFDENDDNQITALDATYWNGGSGWDPIGPSLGTWHQERANQIANESFNATFEGNGHVIANLYIDRNRNWLGLFAALRDTAVVRSLGLPNARVQNGRGSIGVLAGQNSGRVAAVWATGSVQGDTNVGGLVGNNLSGSAIVASYAMASVEGRGSGCVAGGLAASNADTVRASYSTGAVTGACSAANKHGLTSGGTVIASYWDSENSGIADDSDTTAPEGKTTVQLQSPTSDTGIYANWGSLDVNGNGTADENPWRFGASDQYPVLKYADMDTAAQYTAHPPVGVTLTPSLDTLVVRWSAVRNATGYKVQWKSGMQNYPTSDQTGNTHGQATVSSGSDTTYAIASLTNGTTYTVRVLATWPGMIESTPSAEVMGVPGIRYDSDGDGLIEIRTPFQLVVVNWDPNGNGARDAVSVANWRNFYGNAFPNAASGMGCPASGCTGYELLSDVNMSNFTFASIGSSTNPYTAAFEGNGHTISNLIITSSSSLFGTTFGLFGRLTGSVRNVGMVNPNVTTTRSSLKTGALAGEVGVGGNIDACYVSGGSVTVGGASSQVGGLVGVNNGRIRASYATAAVGASGNPQGVSVGGLVGYSGNAEIIASYAAGQVTGSTDSNASAGGLVGFSTGSNDTITASYCDTTATMQTACIGRKINNSPATATGYATAALQMPNTYQGIYTAWNISLTGDSNPDDPWDFGTVNQYPVLKFGRNAATIAAQFSAQIDVPQGVTLTAFEDSLVVRWNAVSSVTGYKVQWKSGNQNYPSSDQTGNTHGQATISSRTDTTYTIASLTAGTSYTVRVLATKTGASDSAPSDEVMGVPLIRYDSDGNGLIDIRSPGNLNGIHWDLNGDGVVAPSDQSSYDIYFPNAVRGMGCPGPCRGYELVADVDFDSDGSGSFDAGDRFWNGGSGFFPIGLLSTASYTGIFEGNGHTISNLFIDRDLNSNVGLFRAVSGGEIRNVGLVNANVSSTADRISTLAGYAEGGAQIVNVYATGQVSGRSGVGGLVGTLNASGAQITASYADVSVTGSGDYAGGLVGRLFAGSITASYAIGAVSAPSQNYVGGLGGRIGGTATVTTSYAIGRVTGGTNSGGLLGGGVTNGTVNSYYDSTTTAQNDTLGNGVPKTTAQLQEPTGYTGIYANWNIDLDSVTGTDDPWDFGADDQYPVLKFGRSADAIAAQFTIQPPGVPQGVTLTAKGDTLVVRWSAVNYATGYKVQWKSGGQSYNMTDRQDTVSVGSDTTYAIANLTPGRNYTVRVLATKTGASDSAPSAEVMGVPPGIRYDGDGNGLIEIGTLAQLNAIRWDRNGDGVVDTSTSTTDSTAYVTAFSNAVAGMGCPNTGCNGYELMADLDFDENDDNQITSADTTYWNGGSGWAPIDTLATTLNGNDHTISHLFIRRASTADIGLFRVIGATGSVTNLGLPNADITGEGDTGALAGEIVGGTVTGVFATGRVTGVDRVGGLVGSVGLGSSTGSIITSYSTASVTGTGTSLYIGGLVGNLSSGEIIAAYATGTVTDANGGGGGLVGAGGGTITASYSTGQTDTTSGGLVGVDFSGTYNNNYYDSETTGTSNTVGATPKTTAQLQEPTGYTGIYASWNANVDGVAGSDDPWDFGAADQYPVLKFGRSADAIAAQFAAQPPGVPQDVTLTPKLDTLVVRWSAARHATGYKVQWKSGGQSYNMTDRQDTVSVGTDTTHAIANLTNGTLYTVRVIATKTGASSDSAPSAEVMGGPGIRYDRDGNGLIEIGTLAQLHAMRWDLNGDGALDTGTSSSDTTAYRAAFPTAASGMGCPANNCIGYELTVDLNFDENDDNQITSADTTYWNGGNGWAPTNTLATTLNGNGHTISHLFINRASTDNSGLFRVIGASGSVTNLGLPDADITGKDDTGTLAGEIRGGTVTGVFATGRVTGVDRVGGLVGSVGLGSSTGSIITSYSTASVTGTGTSLYIGGLVGNFSSGAITAAYATGTVTDATGGDGGGLVGAGGGTITACYATGYTGASGGGLVGVDFSGTYNNNYYDRETTGTSNAIGATPKTTAQLQEPTGYTGIYENWNIDLDGMTGGEDPWNFGAADQYPVLKFGRDADAIAAQFAAQPLGAPQGVTLTALVESLDVRWTAVNYATGYKVQWKSGGQSYNTTDRQDTVSVGSDTTHAIANLTGGMPYTVRVIATKTGAPDGGPSAEQTGTPRSAPPGVPGNVTATPYVLALRVTWDPATDADGYKVQWKTGDQDYDPATREYAVGGTDTTIVDLTAGISYTVRVLATREHADDGPASSESTGMPLAIPSLSITSPIVAEGAAGATDTLRFAVTLSHASWHVVTVAYAMGAGTATAGTDYTALAAGTLTIAPNVLSDTLAVAVIGDGMDEPHETVVITLSTPTNATFGDAGALAGTGTITDDDAAMATLILSPPAISEAGGITTVTATLSSAVTAAVTITISAEPEGHAVPTDFSLSNPATLIIAAGETTSTGLVTITANDNNARAPTKSVTVSGTADAANTVADPDAVTLMITDDESAQVTLVLSRAAISEANEVATVTATLSSAENEAVTITVSATAVAPAEAGDFSLSSAKTLTITAASLTSTGLVTIAALDDMLDGMDKTVTVSGTADGGNNATAPRPVTLTITDDDDPPTLSIESPSLDEGNTGSASLSFGVMLSAASEKQITVAYAMGTGTATAGEDYTALADGTLTFAPGTTSQTLAVSITGDETDEPDETVVITLRDLTNATFTGGATTLTGTGRIINDDPVVATLVLSPEAISEAGGITTVTATLSTPEGAAVTITVSATPEGHAVPEDFSLSTEKTLTIAANGTTSTGLVTIAARDNATDAPDKSVKVSGTADDTPDVVAPPAPVTLTIIDDDDPVNIPDTGLRAVIEDSLDKTSGAPITRAEMATLTRLIAPNKTIRDLTGLEFATGLDTLDLSDNNIEDIEPLVNNAGLGTGAAIDLRGNPLNDPSRDVHVPALEARGVAVHVQPTTNLDIDADGTADLTDAIMVILYLFGLENEGITDYILFSQQATRTDPQAVTAYIETLINTRRVDIDADGTVDLTDIIMVILYLFGLENEGITDYILFSAQAQRTDPQEVTAYIASLLP